MSNGIFKRVLCIGECMVEMSPAGDGLYRQDFAGDSYNTATYLARQFAPQIEVSYLTGLGTTGLSLAMMERFESEGIVSDHVRQMEGLAPGLYLIENDASGERYFQYWRGQSAARSMFAGQSASDLVTEFALFDAIYLSGISLAILDNRQRQTLLDALSILVGSGSCLVVFDPNFRPALWPNRDEANHTVQQMANLSSIALVTLDDDIALRREEALAKDVALRWQAWGAEEVVVKHGAANCLICQGETEWQVAPPQALSPVDTTGAGDSFAAGYLGARLLGQAPDDAAALAHQVAGQVIMHPGGVIAREVWQKIS